MGQKPKQTIQTCGQFVLQSSLQIFGKMHSENKVHGNNDSGPLKYIHVTTVYTEQFLQVAGLTLLKVSYCSGHVSEYLCVFAQGHVDYRARGPDKSL